VVNSAGNDGARGLHAQGSLVTEERADVVIEVPANPSIAQQEAGIWYAIGDTFSCSLASPDGETTTVVAQGNNKSFMLGNDNHVSIATNPNFPFVGQSMIAVRIEKGLSQQVEPGRWTIQLRSKHSTVGNFHAWLLHRNGTRFLPPHQSDQTTISLPGTSPVIISVGSYITRPAAGIVGGRSTFSSKGPTADGRAVPTIVAPGESVISCLAGGNARGWHQAKAGTSMAAPHVAGAVALMLDAWPEAPFNEIVDALVNSARNDENTASGDPTEWGAGKLDVMSAIQAITAKRPY
jgi:subtilisin family serine protease